MALRRERNRHALFAFGCLCLSIICVLNLGNVNKDLGILLAITALFFLVVAFRFLLPLALYWRIENHPLLQVLRKQPENIVWVYSVRTVSSPYGVTIFSMGSFYVKLVNREEFCLSASPKYLKAISTALNPVLPQASFGYSEEKAQWYLAEPAMLYRSKEKK